MVAMLIPRVRILFGSVARPQKNAAIKKLKAFIKKIIYTTVIILTGMAPVIGVVAGLQVPMVALQPPAPAHHGQHQKQQQSQLLRVLALMLKQQMFAAMSRVIVLSHPMAAMPHQNQRYPMPNPANCKTSYGVIMFVSNIALPPRHLPAHHQTVV